MNNAIPPQSLEAEQAVLGSTLFSRDAIVIARTLLRPSDFYREAHRHIYSIILSMHARNEPVDLLTVRSTLDEFTVLEVCGGAAYLMQLVNSVPSAERVVEYCQIVAALARQREVAANPDSILKLT